MRPSHMIALLLVLAGCSPSAGEASEPSASASAASPPAASQTPEAASPSASAGTDWEALPALDGMVTATKPITVSFPGNYTSVTEDGVWMPNGNGGAPAAVARLDPETLEVTAVVQLGGKADAFPPDAEATAPSAHGIWVTLAYQHAVALIDPATNTESRRFPVDGDPYSLVEDGENLWVVDYGNSLVLRFDIATGEETLRITGAAGPTGIKVAFGSVWVVEHDGDLDRIDPETGRIVATIGVGGRPRLTVGFESVWVTSDDRKTVARIDPDTNKVIAQINMPINTTDIEVASGSVWVTAGPQRGACERNSYLVRIDPEINEADGIMNLPCAAGLATDGTHLWAGSAVEGAISVVRIDPTSDR